MWSKLNPCPPLLKEGEGLEPSKNWVTWWGTKFLLERGDKPEKGVDIEMGRSDFFVTLLFNHNYSVCGKSKVSFITFQFFSLTHLLNFFSVFNRISDWHNFCRWKFLYSVSVGTIQLTLSIAIMQVTMSVAITQVLRFYFNYAGGTFCYSYVGGSFCCNHAGDCFYCNYTVRSFCNTYAGDSFCSKYVGTNFYCNHASGSPCCKLCRRYFLQCIMYMTASVAIMQVTVSIIVMWVTVSSNSFIFLFLTDTPFS